MCQKNREFCDLLRSVREGSEEAAWQLVEQYGEVIRRAVRRALSSKLRSKFDSLDFVQIVWSSFFRARDQLDRFQRPEELAAFLLAMTRNKVGMEVRRRLMTEKYNVNREQPLDMVNCDAHSTLAGNEPAPINVAIAREQWDRILAGLPPQYRQIIQLRLQGRTHQQIADQLHVAECTVRRVLKRLFRETVA